MDCGPEASAVGAAAGSAVTASPGRIESRRVSAGEPVLPHHAVERAVQRVAAAPGRFERALPRLRRVRDPAERLALDLAVPHVGVLVDGEELSRVALLDPVEVAQARALR